MKKKILSLALAAALCFSAAACTNNGNNGNTGATENTVNAENEPEANGADTTNQAGDNILIMGTNAEFPPYEYYENNQIVGIDAEIAAAIAQKLGMEFRIDDMAFDSIIPAVTSGKITMGMAGMTVTDERLQSVDFTDSYATGVQVIIVKEGSEITNVDDLLKGGYTIGVQTNTTGDIYSTSDFEEEGLAKIERFNKGADAVQALATDKLDCVIIDNEPAKAFVGKNTSLKILETEYITEDYAICMAKESPLYEDVNKALKELIEDGTVKSIVDKYIKAE